jgi:hypothetical protein
MTAAAATHEMTTHWRIDGTHEGLVTEVGAANFLPPSMLSMLADGFTRIGEKAADTAPKLFVGDKSANMGHQQFEA